MLTISRVLLGWYGLKSPGFFSGLEPSLPMPRPTSFELFLAFSHGPLSMPQNASEHSLPHHHQPPWPNGQGAGLLIRRLWSISLAARTQCLLPARTHHATWHTDSFLLVSHLSSHCGSHWFTVLSHLQLVSSMAKKQASQSPKNIPKHKLVEP